MAQDTLARAESEHTLVTHWFLTPEDASVNADPHFGSDARTVRFLGVAFPTLVDQLGASAAVVVLPWGLTGGEPSLTVVAVRAGEPARVQTRRLTRLGDENGAPGPPFWRLESAPVAPPSELAAVAARLTP